MTCRRHCLRAPPGNSSRQGFGWAAALVALCCGKAAPSQPIDAEAEPHAAPPPLDAGEGSAGSPLCGARGDVCCPVPLPACAVGLRCDEGSQRCERNSTSSRLCRSEADCAAGERCCPSGVFGSCASLGPTDGCPNVDLAVSIDESWLSIYQSSVAPNSCQRSCFTGIGERRSLQVPVTLFNLGAVDVVLAADNAPGWVQQCGGAPASAEAVLRFELRDQTGLSIRQQDAHLSVCNEVGTSCDFQALEHEHFATDAAACPLDITALPGGEYTLDVGLSFDSVSLPDSHPENDHVQLQVRLPPFPARPTAECPEAETYLFGVNGGRECGWRSARSELCSPGENIALGCADCLGYPMARVCAGTQACDSNAPELLALWEGGLAHCPSLAFACPDSGSYTTLTASTVAQQDFDCELERIALPSDPLAACEPLQSEIRGPERECGWSAAPSAACTPGSSVAVACNDCTSLFCNGCPGAVALRVCEGDGPCLSSSSQLLASSPAFESGCPRLPFTCPASGRYTALAAPSFPGFGPDCEPIAEPGSAGAPEP